ncbi:MAG: TolC family protein, partial [Thiotrichaceae bacterium]|nr:TolC family protein [Thiotrichaceae bacterium]
MSLSKKTGNTLFAFSCLIALTTSSLTSAESLLQVYQHAKKNDTQLQISETNLLATLEKKPQVMSALKPKVDLGANASHNLQYTDRTLGGTSKDSFSNLGYNLSLGKPLINKQLDAQVAQVDASILQAKASLEIDKQGLIIRVADAYFQYLNAEETLVFRKAERTAIDRQLNQVKAYFDAGRSAITDVKEAQARYDLTNAQVVIAQQQIDVARESLKAITTRYYTKLKGASENIPLITPKPNSIEAWEKTAIANSLQVIVAQHAIDVAQKTIDIERAAKSPTLSLFANHTGSSTLGEDAFDLDKFDASVGMIFSMPLYEGGNIDSRVREARLRLKQSRQQLELQKRLTAQQTRAAYLTILSGLAQVNALK